MQKACSHGKLACQWGRGFIARPYMSMKWIAARQWQVISNDRFCRTNNLFQPANSRVSK